MGNIQESVDVQPVHREDFHGEKRIRTWGGEKDINTQLALHQVRGSNSNLLLNSE